MLYIKIVCNKKNFFVAFLQNLKNKIVTKTGVTKTEFQEFQEFPGILEFQEVLRIP
jgi:hypothetical protein